jgi:pimeloyl-ACP methyl ester carboxylesterase
MAHQTVTTPDGTHLHVTSDGDPDAAVTVVFVHGFCMSHTSWVMQTRHLTHQWGRGNLHIVTYDQRGHGRSSRNSGPLTLENLADDLDAVLATTTRGPVVLVGHSMGGMTILTHADRHPRTRHRIVGCALISTAATELHTCGVGRLLRSPAVPLLAYAAHRCPKLAAKVWNTIRGTLAPLAGIRCASPARNPLQVSDVTSTPIATIAALLPEFRRLDQRAGLRHLPAGNTVIACGTADLITPPRHSVSMHTSTTAADLVTVDGAGHFLPVETPDVVDQLIDQVIARTNLLSVPIPA